MSQANFFPQGIFMNSRDDQEIMKPLEVADYLRIGKNKVYHMLETGELKGFKIGNIWCIPRESVNLYVRQKAGLI